MDAERRQVTVLFTDMVGFTSFSERSGEEAAYTLMRSLSKLMGEAVREQDGVVQGFTGDGIMAVFGPLRHHLMDAAANHLATSPIAPTERAKDRKIYGRSRITNHVDLLPGMNGNNPAARRFRDLVQGYVSDMGGIDRIRSVYRSAS